jgi:hypothetical protein
MAFPDSERFGLTNQRHQAAVPDILEYRRGRFTFITARLRSVHRNRRGSVFEAATFPRTARSVRKASIFRSPSTRSSRERRW